MLDLLYASKETSVQLVAMGLFMLLVGRYWKAVCTKKAAQGNPDESLAATFSPSLKGHEIQTAIDGPGAPRNYATRSAERNLRPLPAPEIRLAGQSLPPVPST